jgi:tetratricopeptide (TPR) repeat protein
MIQKIKSAVQIAAIFCALLGIGLLNAHAIQITTNPADSSLVDTLNKRAFNSRLKNSKLSLVEAKQALSLAKKLHYTKGEAEAYRMMGLASYYLFETEKSISYYLKALSIYGANRDKLGQAKVLNNIGILYYQTDYTKASVYFNRALKLALPLRDTGMLANIYLNMGNINVRTKRHSQALDDYIKAEKMFSAVGDKTGIVHSLQNCGKIFLDRSMFDQAENFLVKAYKLAKEEGLSESIASINLSLASIYIAKKNYTAAEKYLIEGMRLANETNDEKMVNDFNHTYYELEAKRKNYGNALHFLQLVYKQDSVNFRKNETAKIDLIVDQSHKNELIRKNELYRVKQEKKNIILVLSLVITGLLFILIILLVRSVRQKNRDNEELLYLNEEIHSQKNQLLVINKHLKGLVNEKSKLDKINAIKINELSTHLPHDVRGPLSTLKAIIELDDEKMISHKELVRNLKICVEVLEIKIKRINDLLLNPKAKPFYDD